MRPTFLFDADMRPISALVTKGVEDAFKLHYCTTLVTDYQTEYGMIPAGLKGYVDYIDPENGTVEILMEGWEPALLHWGNILILVPFDTDDLASCLRVTRTARRLELVEGTGAQTGT